MQISSSSYRAHLPSSASRQAKSNQAGGGDSYQPGDLTLSAMAGGLSAIPVLGAGYAWEGELVHGLKGDQTTASLLDIAGKANLGGTIALAAGLVVGTPLLVGGAVALGFSGLAGAYGMHRLLSPAE